MSITIMHNMDFLNLSHISKNFTHFMMRALSQKPRKM